MFWFSLSVGGSKQSPVEAKLIKDGKVLPLKDVEVIVADDKATFKFKKPARNLSGIYQLKISNAQGEDTKNININMQGNTDLFIIVYWHININLLTAIFIILF